MAIYHYWRKFDFFMIWDSIQSASLDYEEFQYILAMVPLSHGTQVTNIMADYTAALA